MKTIVKILVLFCVGFSEVRSVDIRTTEVFFMPLEVNSFNWGTDRSLSKNKNGFRFRPTIAGAPDLPAWLSYAYCERNKTGFLYGVPPDLAANYKVNCQINFNKFLICNFLFSSFNCRLKLSVLTWTTMKL